MIRSYTFDNVGKIDDGLLPLPVRPKISLLILSFTTFRIFHILVVSE